MVFSKLHSLLLQVHSDEFLPSHISTSLNIKYDSLDMKAIVNNPKRPTGASRYFNWVGRCAFLREGLHTL